MKTTPGILCLLLAVFMGTFFSGCYYTKQGYYLLSYQAKAKSAEKLLRGDEITPETREFLLLVEEIRQFAVEELGLKTNKNYTKYLHLDQDVLAWVVSACEPLRFETYLWNYPVMGKLPYKGFYKTDDARKEGAKLREKGLDVWIRGVEAFSTLGFFKDPLISYMASYSVYDLANLIIHEQTHATVWKKGDTPFNEDLASFVGDVGARLFVLHRFGAESPEYLSIDENQADSRRYREDILRLREELEAFYSGLPEVLDEPQEAQAARRKEEIIREFQAGFLEDYDRRYTGEGYRAFGELPVNNAYIDLFQLYHGQRQWFEERFEAAGGDMRKFMEMMKEDLP